MSEFDDLPLFKMADHRLSQEEKPRISSQCQKILDRLREGVATNRELSALSMKYTSRISDIRASGHTIEVVSRDVRTGLTLYRLVS
jgi:hypothetical protein